jgi:DNA-binding MarR family transcriptional regulator
MAAARMARRDFEALAEFRFQLRRFMRFADDSAKAEGLTPLQFQLLQLKGLPSGQDASIGVLAERMQTVHHGIVALVTRCERAGLVERVPGRTDRRQVLVRLTAVGDRAVTRIASANRNELLSLSGVFQVTRLSAFNNRR